MRILLGVGIGSVGLIGAAVVAWWRVDKALANLKW